MGERMPFLVLMKCITISHHLEALGLDMTCAPVYAERYESILVLCCPSIILNYNSTEEDLLFLC